MDIEYFEVNGVYRQYMEKESTWRFNGAIVSNGEKILGALRDKLMGGYTRESIFFGSVKETPQSLWMRLRKIYPFGNLRSDHVSEWGYTFCGSDGIFLGTFLNGNEYRDVLGSSLMRITPTEEKRLDELIPLKIPKAIYGELNSGQIEYNKIVQAIKQRDFGAVQFKDPVRDNFGMDENVDEQKLKKVIGELEKQIEGKDIQEIFANTLTKSLWDIISVDKN